MQLSPTKTMKTLSLSILFGLCSTVVVAQTAPVTTNKQNNTTMAPQTTTPAPAKPSIGPDSNTIQIVTRPEITGLWAIKVPGNQCVEYYNFRGSNELVVKSGNEWTYGIFNYLPPQDANEKLPILAMQFKYNNGQQDCSGRRDSDLGGVTQLHVKWNTPSSISFCETEKGQNCLLNLNRVLP